jgi:hypothetical protein
MKKYPTAQGHMISWMISHPSKQGQLIRALSISLRAMIRICHGEALDDMLRNAKDAVLATRMGFWFLGGGGEMKIQEKRDWQELYVFVVLTRTGEKVYC